MNPDRIPTSPSAGAAAPFRKPLQMADPPVDPALCVRCKGGKRLCGKPCYLMNDIQHAMPQVRLDKEHVQGPSPPGVFVGRHGYPAVRVGPLVPPLELEAKDLARMADSTAWYGESIQDIVAQRSTLVHGKRLIGVREARDPGRVLQTAQEVALSDRPVDTELWFTKVPGRNLAPRLGETVPPMGPGVDTKKAVLAENPHVPRIVDRLVDDTDATATTALSEFQRSQVGVDAMQRLLSLGLLGRGEARKLVPTRWSITAVDDTLGKELITRVKDLPELQEIRIHRAAYNGNHFHILLLPRPWGFDMQETWHAGSMWAPVAQTAVDWEEYGGRTTYASNITGAYYAARLAVLEHLVHKVRRQATAVVVREITDEYWAPLGVWLIRETVRHAMADKPLVFGALDAACRFIDRHTRIADWRQSSHFLGPGGWQRTLAEY